MNIKGIAHKTVWVDYPDIHTVYEKHDIEAIEKRLDGSPYYSLPIIYDPKTGKTVADSLLIAEYLDETYPDTQRLVPEGTHMLHTTFMQSFRAALSEDFFDVVYNRTIVHLSPRGKEWYEKKLSARSKEWYDKNGRHRGMKSEKDGLKEVQKGLDKVESWYKPGDKFASGSQKLIFADLMIAGFLVWAKILLGEESAEWQDTLTWHNGRWKALFDELKPFEQVL